MARNLEAGVVRLREAGRRRAARHGRRRRATARWCGRPAAASAIYNSLIWSIARRHGAYVVDLWGMRSLRDWRMWAEDRIHLTTDGHARVAQGALVGLGLTPDDAAWDDPLTPLPPDAPDAEGPRGRRLGARARVPVGDAAAARDVVGRRPDAQAPGAVAGRVTRRRQP